MKQKGRFYTKFKRRKAIFLTQKILRYEDRAAEDTTYLPNPHTEQLMLLTGVHRPEGTEVL